jgi:hypothetical protein
LSILRTIRNRQQSIPDVFGWRLHLVKDLKECVSKVRGRDPVHDDQWGKKSLYNLSFHQSNLPAADDPFWWWPFSHDREIPMPSLISSALIQLKCWA